MDYKAKAEAAIRSSSRSPGQARLWCSLAWPFASLAAFSQSGSQRWSCGILCSSVESSFKQQEGASQAYLAQSLSPWNMHSSHSLLWWAPYGKLQVQLLQQDKEKSGAEESKPLLGGSGDEEGGKAAKKRWVSLLAFDCRFFVRNNSDSAMLARHTDNCENNLQ